MTQTQLTAIILNQLLAHVAYLSHVDAKGNVGQVCPFCHATGELRYGAGVTYQHSPACAFTLNDQLQASLLGEENAS
jgi:hypothetical protein